MLLFGVTIPFIGELQLEYYSNGKAAFRRDIIAVGHTAIQWKRFLVYFKSH